MLVSEIKARVKRQFGDESGVQVTDTDIVRWINDSQREIVKRNEGLLEVTAVANAVANQQDYVLPANLLILKTIKYKETPTGNSYVKLQGCNFVEFNEYVDGWDGATDRGDPVSYTVFAGNYSVFPIPSAALTAGFKLYYNRIPTDVINDGDTPELPTLYHEAIVKYCLAQAFEIDEDWDGANLKLAQMEDDVKTLRGRVDWKTQDTYPTITVRYEDL